MKKKIGDYSRKICERKEQSAPLKKIFDILGAEISFFMHILRGHSSPLFVVVVVIFPFYIT